VSRTHAIKSPEEAIERLRTLPGGRELLAQAAKREDIALVGGAVRDLLLGHWPRELDVTVAGDSAGLASAIAASISPSERPYGHAVQPVLHERFSTASVVWGYGRIDIAELRAESYAAPGALPEVRPAAGAQEDLVRRDFTVNALALPLAGGQRGRILAVDGALEDLAAGVLRILHEQSFRDDPTRILRLARYAARLDFDVEPATRALATQAIESGALKTVSGGRVGAELLLAAREADARAAMRMLDEMGVLAALGIQSPFDDDLAAAAEALLPSDGARDALLMAVTIHGAPRPTELIAGLELPGELGTRVLAAVEGASGLADEVEQSKSPAASFGVLDKRPLETVVLAGALTTRREGAAATAFRDWIDTARHVRLQIDGNDLLRAGVPEGPDIGLRLDAALRRKREGLTPDRDGELRAALETGL
jgi:tRNA nucleotidyltransferase (CCA-adding enzyme)